MRTVTYGAACSLDGYIAAADGSIDWLHFSRDVHDIMAKYWATVDVVLMGRKTWEVALAMEGGGASGGGGEGAAAGEPRPEKKEPARKRGSTARSSSGSSSSRRKPTGQVTYVFSRTLRELTRPSAELVSGDAGDFVRDLKQQPGKGICVMGGGELAASLFDAGVIDEVGLNIHPIILGAGVPFFGAIAHRVPLELTECRTIDGGCVLANYRVRR